MTDITGSGGGSGTVTTFSAGNFSPIFNSSVANPTTAPALTFTALTFGAHLFYGNNTGSTAIPGAQRLACADLSDSVTACNSLTNLVLITPNLGTPSAINLINATGAPTWNQNTTGTASNLSGTPALPNGTTGTAQAAGDNTTKLATDSFVHTEVANAIAGVNPAVAVQAATPGTVLPNTPTFTSVASGIGSFFTSSTNSVLVVDGYTPILGDRILVKNQSATQNNGVYKVTQLGVASVLPWIITRALDFDQPSDINNTGAIPIINGTAGQIRTQWVVSSQVNTVDTDPIVFTQFGSDPTTLITTSTACGGNLTGTMPNCTAPSGASVATPNTFANLPGTCTPNGANAIFYATDSFYEFICTATNTYSAFRNGRKYTLPIDANFSWQNQGGATKSAANGPEILTTAMTSGEAIRARVITLPAAPYEFEFAFQVMLPANAAGWAGPCISDGTKYEVTRYLFQNDLRISDYTNTTTQSADPASITGWNQFASPSTELWMKIKDDSTNRIWSYSANNGITYQQLLSVTNTAFLTPTVIGICASDSNTARPLTITLTHLLRTI